MKTKLFLEICNEIQNILEKELPFLQSYMYANPSKKEYQRKVLIILRKISRKITVLEENEVEIQDNIRHKVDNIRSCYFEIKEIITGDYSFKSKPFPEESVNKVIKKVGDIVFKLDQVKLSIFN